MAINENANIDENREYNDDFSDDIPINNHQTENSENVVNENSGSSSTRNIEEEARRENAERERIEREHLSDEIPNTNSTNTNRNRGNRVNRTTFPRNENPTTDEELNSNGSDTPNLQTGQRQGIFNKKYKNFVIVIAFILIASLLFIGISSLFGGGKKKQVQEETVEENVANPTFQKDEIKAMQDNATESDVTTDNLGQGLNYGQTVNEYNSNLPVGTDLASNNNQNIDGAIDNQGGLTDSEIDRKEQESLQALEELEKNIDKQTPSDDNTGYGTDEEIEQVAKPRKNRNTLKIENAPPIGIYRGAMNDRIEYLSAKTQKDDALNQLGATDNKRGSGVGNGKSGSGNGGYTVNYKANKVDQLASEVFGTDPTGVQGSATVGGSGNGRTKVNRTPYYAYEKEEGQYDIFEGTIIPAVITNQINSDYAGRVTAIVREDVYDSLTGNFLLIPKGSKIMGDMLPLNSNGGVERVATVWDRIILTNGDNIFLENFRGQDLTGIDGIEGKVNKRYFKKIASIVASSVFEGTLGIVATLPEILLRKYDNRNGVIYSERGGQAGDRIGQSLTQIVDGETQKIVQRPNTVTIKSGTKVNIVVNVDIRLPKFQRER